MIESDLENRMDDAFSKLKQTDDIDKYIDDMISIMVRRRVMVKCSKLTPDKFALYQTAYDNILAYFIEHNKAPDRGDLNY